MFYQSSKRLTYLTIGLVVLAFANLAAAVEFEYKTIPGAGRTDTCMSLRETALNQAHDVAKNGAYNDCRDLGDGWRFDKPVVLGYEQIIPCRNGKEFRAEITKAVFRCKRAIKQGVLNNNASVNNKPPEMTASSGKPAHVKQADSGKSEQKSPPSKDQGNRVAGTGKPSSTIDRPNGVAEQPTAAMKMNEDPKTLQKASAKVSKYDTSDNGKDVDWDAANRYCKKRDLDLPTVAELKEIQSNKSEYHLTGPAYWSKERDRYQAMYVNFYQNKVVTRDIIDSLNLRAICVRRP